MKTRALLAFGTALAVVGLSAGAAHAASAPTTHDGFYLRFGAGFGYASDTIKYTGPFGLGDTSGKGQGGSGLFDVNVGYSIKPGLAIGGGLYIEQVVSPKVKFGNVDVSNDYSVGTLAMIGPMIDWYPEARGGFHLGGVLGAARLTVKDSANNQLDNSPIGGGGAFFIGYDWWVGDEWSIGVEARLLGATLHESNIGTGAITGNVTHTWASGGALFTVTYN